MRASVPGFGLLLLLVGCGGGQNMVDVEGRVLFDGQPLKFGSVVFQPTQGGQPARGEIQPDGSFKLSTFREGDGAVIGTNRVRVLCYKAQDPARADAGPRGDSLGQSLIPKRYTNASTSGLVVEISKADNKPVLLELTSGGP